MYHVALITDDGYLLPTLVTAKSVLANCHNTAVHVCTFGLNDKSIDIFNSFSSAEKNVFLNVFDRKKFEDRLSTVNQNSHVTPVALIKFELANYFQEIDHILYLDSDIIVKKCIENIFTIDITEYYLAASFEFWQYIYNYCYKFGKKDNDFYFNSGVMFLNLKKIREDNLSEKLWEYKLYHTKTTLMDQECLNAVCLPKVLPLSISYNFNPIFYDNKYLDAINYVYGEYYKSAEEILSNAAILHYVGKHDKPWKFKNASKREYWDTYYKLIDELPELNLIEYRPEKLNLLQKISKKIKNVGILGLISNIIFRRVR